MMHSYLIELCLLLSFIFCNGIDHSSLRSDQDQCDSLSRSLGKSSTLNGDSKARKQTHVFRENVAGLSNRQDIIKMQRGPESHMHEIIFRIKGKNDEKLSEILHDVSNPHSKNYGKHMTSEEITELTSNKLSHDRVIKYLKAAGATIVSQTISEEYVTAAASIGLWEKLLDTHFNVYHHVHESSNIVNMVVRSESYSVPLQLDQHVTSVFNTIQMPFSIWSQPIIVPIDDDKSGIRANFRSGFVNPAVLKAFYRINNDIGNSASTQAVFATIGQYYSPADLRRFQELFSLIPQKVAVEIGGQVSDSACISTPNKCAESNLDLQYLMGISQRSPTTIWYTNLNSFANWLITVADMANPPKVISISYGANEDEISRSEFESFNSQAIRLAVMGVTIVVASGDDGASSYYARFNRQNCGYMPVFPATSPYVIAVGGTQGPEVSAREITCQSNLGGGITSGGGFSTYYPRPSWQGRAVPGYFRYVMGTKLQPIEGYNSSGRGYPDISLAGSSYQVFLGGRQYSISGTSAATPVVAGMISLVNAARIAEGKNTLGWINPTLYANHQMFTNDVVEGFTNCTAGSPPLVCCKEGFHGTIGWDPTTGFGSIDFVAFKDFFVRFGEVNLNPSRIPTSSPISSLRPTLRPTFTQATTQIPTRAPSQTPSQTPTQIPSQTPTRLPTQRVNPPRGSFGNTRPILGNNGQFFQGPKVVNPPPSTFFFGGQKKKAQKNGPKKIGKGKGFE